MGCSAIDRAADVWRLLLGHISSGIRVSRTYAASRPSLTRSRSRSTSARGSVRTDSSQCAGTSSTVMSSTMRTPCPSRSAPPLDRLPDRRQAEALPRVDREMGVLATQELKGVEVARGRVAGLRTRDVEARDAMVAVADRQLGDLRRLGGVTHGRQEGRDADLVTGGGRPGLAVAESRVDGLDDLEAEAGHEVLLGRIPALRVHDSVSGEVLGALARDPVDPVGGLHDGERLVERLEVAGEGSQSRRCRGTKPSGSRIGRREALRSRPPPRAR